MGRCTNITPATKKICSSALDKYITLAAKIKTSSSFNDNQYGTPYDNLVDIWAAIETKNGEQRFGASNDPDTLTHIFYIRWQLITSSIVSATINGNTLTATTSGNHYLKSGMNVFIDGADQSEYNGLFVVKSDDDDNIFSYNFTGSPSSPTGTITFSREIQTTDVVLFNNYVYTISRVENVDNNDKWIKLHCVYKGPFN